MATRQSLIRIAEKPQGMRRIGMGKDPTVHAVLGHLGVMLLGVVSRTRLIEVFKGANRFARMSQNRTQSEVGDGSERGLHLVWR